MSKHGRNDTVRWVDTHGDVTRISGVIAEAPITRPYVRPSSGKPKHAKG